MCCFEQLACTLFHPSAPHIGGGSRAGGCGRSGEEQVFAPQWLRANTASCETERAGKEAGAEGLLMPLFP